MILEGFVEGISKDFFFFILRSLKYTAFFGKFSRLKKNTYKFNISRAINRIKNPFYKSLRITDN